MDALEHIDFGPAIHAAEEDKPNAAYFLCGGPGEDLRPVDGYQALSLWTGTSNAGVNPAATQATLVSVIRRGLRVKTAFLANLQLADGLVTREARQQAIDEADLEREDFESRDARLLRDLTEMWLPSDWRTQLAVALDVPAAHFDQFMVGGPLVIASKCQLHPDLVIAQLAGD